MMRVAVVLGTRPEAIKLAPLIHEFKADHHFECVVCSTGQHREMLDQVLSSFAIVPDHDLELMRPDQGLAELTSVAVSSLDRLFASLEPSMVMVQGDTTSTFCAALAAFYRNIPVAHVEAGLRTGNLRAPWPEEANRLLTTRLTNLHFAPTEANRGNLLREGVPEQFIHVTGNTVVDALLMAVRQVRKAQPKIARLPEFLQPGSSGPRMVLITSHRRENFGAGLVEVLKGIADLAHRFSDVHFVYPVHLNPAVRQAVASVLGGAVAAGDTTRPGNMHLVEPLDYMSFVALMDRAFIILTDSGGVQEEAPSLAKPVLVMRDTTERWEAIEAGSVRLVGTSPSAIREAATQLLTDPAAYAAMATGRNPYGDGQASRRIVAVLRQFS